MLRTFAVVTSVLAFGLVATPAMAEAQWTTNYAEAQKAAARSGKPILAFFTGSDWCGYCKVLKKEVLDTPQFAQWAAQNVVLLEVDFPNNTPQPDELKKQNAELKTKFGPVSGYPTVMFVGSDEKVIDKIGGYTPGSGLEAYITKATGIVGKYEPPTPPFLLDSYQSALAAAKENGRPLLLVVSRSNIPKLQENLANMLDDDEFVKFAENRIFVVHIPLPGAASEEDLEAIANVRKQNRVAETPLQIMLIDPQEEKVLMKDSRMARTTKLFVGALEKKLPAPKPEP